MNNLASGGIARSRVLSQPKDRSALPADAPSLVEKPWTDLLGDVTPVAQGLSGLWYKREDFFAPLGYGGVNGSKLRQLIWIMQDMRDGVDVVTACSVLSPQSSMTAVVGRHFGITVKVMLGATYLKSALKHENVKIAACAGAEIIFTPVAYNPALQRACVAYAEQHALHRVPYGITTEANATPETVTQFHLVAAPQVVNIPAEVRTLILPFGSGNSVTGVLTGLAKYGSGNINRVVLVGIGPNRLEWLNNRLETIENVADICIRDLFAWPGTNDPGIILDHYDLHGTGYVKYSDRRRWRQDGIDFHPTYEGKIMEWMHDVKPSWYQPEAGNVLFWIVASEGRLSAMESL